MGSEIGKSWSTSTSVGTPGHGLSYWQSAFLSESRWQPHYKTAFSGELPFTSAAPDPRSSGTGFASIGHLVWATGPLAGVSDKGVAMRPKGQLQWKGARMQWPHTPAQWVLSVLGAIDTVIFAMLM